MFRHEKWQRRLDDILDRLAQIDEALKGRTFDDFGRDAVLVAALERHFSVIGEAVNFIPETVRREFPAVPWQDMYGMRNIIVHGYDVVSLPVLWDSARSDMPQLKKTILAIKEKYGDG